MAFFTESVGLRKPKSALAGGLAFLVALAAPITATAGERKPASSSRAVDSDPVLFAARERQWEEEARMRAEEEAAGPEGSPGRIAFDKRRKAERCLESQKIIKKNGKVGLMTGQGLDANCPPDVAKRVRDAYR
ncbi:MAG: hypothetical protein V4449_03105 [Patescibacteria group bacterium]